MGSITKIIFELNIKHIFSENVSNDMMQNISTLPYLQLKYRLVIVKLQSASFVVLYAKNIYISIRADYLVNHSAS